MLGSQRVVLFGKVVEPLGREALQEEVGPWRRAFRISILVSFLIYSLLPICWCKVTSGLRTGHCPPKVLILEKSKQGPSTGPVAWCWLCGLMGRDALAGCDVLGLCHTPLLSRLSLALPVFLLHSVPILASDPGGSNAWPL